MTTIKLMGSITTLVSTANVSYSIGRAASTFFEDTAQAFLIASLACFSLVATLGLLIFRSVSPQPTKRKE